MNDIEAMEAFMRAMQKNAEKKAEREERIRKEAHEALLVRQAEAEKQRKEQERWDSLSEEEKKAELAESKRKILEAIKKSSVGTDNEEE